MIIKYAVFKKSPADNIYLRKNKPRLGQLGKYTHFIKIALFESILDEKQEPDSFFIGKHLFRCITSV